MEEESTTHQSTNRQANRLESVQQNELQHNHISQNKEQPVSVQSMYCKELVFGGDIELSFEELRARRFFKHLNEKILHLSKVKEELKVEIEQKQKLIEERKSAVVDQQLEEEPQYSNQTIEGTCVPVIHPKTTTLKIYSEPEMPSTSVTRNTLVSQDEDLVQGEGALKQWSSQASKLFTVHDENMLSEKPNTRSSSRIFKTLKLPISSLKIGQPASECVSDKDNSISRSEEAIINGHWNKTLCRGPDDTCDFVRAAQMASTPFGGPVRHPPTERAQMKDHEALSKTASVTFNEPSSTTAKAKNLSPIEEISQEWGHSSCFLEPESRARASSNFGNPEETSSTTGRMESALNLESETMNPLSLEARRALLDDVDLSSFANFIMKADPLPEIQDLHLDGETLFFLKKMADPDTYMYMSNRGRIFIKVDRSLAPWDFYISSQLSARLPAHLKNHHTPSACYLYENGSLTLWRIPQGLTLQELIESSVHRRDVPLLAIKLLEMVKWMHSCQLVHGALRPNTLLVCGSYEDRVITGIEFSSSLDLRLQTEVKMAHTCSSAQPYIKQGLLLPSASPYQVDLCGVAEIVHLLLVGKSMELVKQGPYWSLAKEAETHLGDPLGPVWEGFFHNILNPQDNTTESVLSNLISSLKSSFFPL